MQLVNLSPEELGDWQKPKAAPKKKKPTGKKTVEEEEKEEDKNEEDEENEDEPPMMTETRRTASPRKLTFLGLPLTPGEPLPLPPLHLICPGNARLPVRPLRTRL